MAAGLESLPNEKGLLVGAALPAPCEDRGTNFVFMPGRPISEGITRRMNRM
jgi:hypothetical protein